MEQRMKDQVFDIGTENFHAMLKFMMRKTVVDMNKAHRP
jgi:hypothetical protein